MILTFTDKEMEILLESLESIPFPSTEFREIIDYVMYVIKRGK